MKVSRILIVLTLPALAVVAAPPTTTPTPSAASLADAVRKARGEPQPTEGKKSLGVITNETLKGGTPVPGKKGTVTILPGATAAPDSSTGYNPAAEPRDSTGRSEQDWRRLVASHQKKASEAEDEVRRLESEARKLENDFYAWDDGTYRDNVIKPNLEKTREDLQKARLRAESYRQAQENLREEARKAGAPPGWLRPGGPAPATASGAKGARPTPPPTPEISSDN
jgi:hypothetical protein